MPAPFENGGLKWIIGLFLTALLVPLLAGAFGYGSLSQKVSSFERDLQDHYATRLEVQVLRGDIKSILIILQSSALYTPEVKKQVDIIQRQTDERFDSNRPPIN